MSNESESTIQLSDIEQLIPQEEMLECAPKKKHINIGLPKEVCDNEHRITLVPEAVALLVDSGNTVTIEKDAGNAAKYTNEQYASAGANIVNTAQEIYNCDIIVKIAPPTEQEINMLAKHKILFSSLSLQNYNKRFFSKLMSKKVIALAYENITDKLGDFPIMKSDNEIAGKTAVLIAAQYLMSFIYGKGKLLGGVPGVSQAKIVIIGAGTVAENAARVAIGLGANVTIFDNSISKLRNIQNNIGHYISTLTTTTKSLTNALKTADIVISAMFESNTTTPCLISDEMVKNMESGSIIIDASIAQGACFETSRITTLENPVYISNGVTHYCVPNIASCTPNTSSQSLSNILTPMLLEISQHGGVEQMLKQIKFFGNGVYIYNGILTNNHIGNMFGMASQDLELLMSAFR